MIRPEKNFSMRSDRFLLNHPFYQAWVEGKLSLSTLQDYAKQYFHHVEAFPHYLENAMGLCGDGEARKILAENLSEENGSAYGTSHPELWLRFAEGLGVARSDAQGAAPRPGIQCVVDAFQSFSRKSLPCALGALYAYEFQVPEIACSKIEGLKAHYGVTDERTLSFFEVHKHADIEHREDLLRLIESLPADQQRQAQQAADEAAQALWDFLSDVQEVNQAA